MRKNFTLLGIFLTLIVHLTTAQTRMRYEKTSPWFMGINTGVTWNTNDVKTDFNGGVGLILGRSFGYNYGRPIFFDLRGRYLYGHWYGQDTDSTFFEAPNQTLSSGNTNYLDTYGHAVNNHFSEVHELDLELAMHFNRLRENTGWDPYIFGGIGISWNRTAGNLLNSSGLMYDYSTIDLNKPQSEIQFFDLDNSYETPLDGSNAQGRYRADWMPSLGVGIGYSIGTMFSLGLEHKTTFTMADYFDGYANPNSNIQNDWYHYTNFYMKWYFGRGHASSTVDCNDPVIQLVNPSVANLTVNEAQYLFEANVAHVTKKSELMVTHNGREVPFDFFPNNSRVQARITLIEGANTISISAKNDCKAVSENVSLNYVPLCQEPVITLGGANQLTVPATTATQSISAQVSNYQFNGQMQVSVNGVNTTNFTLNQQTGQFAMDVPLTRGANTVVIVVTNACGTDTETIVITQEPPCDKPVIQLIAPQNSLTTQNASVVLKAKITGIQQASQVVVRLNGNPLTAGTYNTSTSLFEKSITLNPGQNTIEVTATNDCSPVTVTLTVTKEVDCQLPIVNLLGAQTNQLVQSNAFSLNAGVQNITNANQVSVFVNGVQQSAGTFNAATGQFQKPLTLVQGTNTIEIRATNNCGPASQFLTVNFQPCELPTVSITAPLSGQTTNSQNIVLTAQLSGVTNANQVQVTVNGATQSAGTYDAVRNVFTKPLVLAQGNNTVVVTVTNACGSQSASTTVVYTPCELPVVVISQPVQNAQLTDPNVTLIAQIEGITSANQIQVTVNGVQQSQGNYFVAQRRFEKALTVRQGVSTIVITVTNACGTQTVSTTVNYSPCASPVVAITAPTNGQALTNNQLTFTATVNNVQQASQIQLFVNGAPQSAGSFNASTGQYSKLINLQGGTNVIELKANNGCSEVTQSVQVTYTPCVSPTVTILQPQSGSTSAAQTVQVSAKITGVSNANQIQLTQNGATVANGTYNATTQMFTANITLAPGQNNLVINANNSCGAASSNATVSFSPCAEPIIFLPQLNMNQTTEQLLNFTATLTNVTNASQIQLTHNGAVLTGFNFNASNGQLTKQITLVAGSNNIEVRVNNGCATKFEAINVKYAPCELPTIAITSPANGSTVQASGQTLNFTVSGQVAQNQVQVTLNGRVINAVLGRGNVYTANMNLQSGANSIVVTATNSCGTVSETISVTYTPCELPVITLVSPVNGFNSTDKSLIIAYQLSAGVSQQQVTLNGSVVSIPFNAASQTYTTKLNLQEGTNSVVITATNACGTTTETFTFTYTPCNAPTATIITPTNGLTTTDLSVIFKASTTGVTSLSEIVLMSNGVVIPVTGYNASNGVITQQVPLQMGANTIKLTVTTSCGRDIKQVLVTRNAVAPPPVVDSMQICMTVNGVPTTIKIPSASWSQYQQQGATEGPCVVINNDSDSLSNGNGFGNTGGGGRPGGRSSEGGSGGGTRNQEGGGSETPSTPTTPGRTPVVTPKTGGGRGGK